ncbi:hypothetical protein CH063_03947 [Colletotrichum higginsianum]|uniref:Uncharacterized protein n=1 Tax=Colletotrichum higginsianum (strain IMI 349063) TaxID=759273 RepID=H1W2Q5_COLHI|nr:hypothetical protein CH063_03947 [Colletotrichum higginsianum]
MFPSGTMLDRHHGLKHHCRLPAAESEGLPGLSYRNSYAGQCLCTIYLVVSTLIFRVHTQPILFSQHDPSFRSRGRGDLYYSRLL